MGEASWGDTVQTGVETIREMIGGARTAEDPRDTTQLRAALLVLVTKLGWTFCVCVFVSLSALYLSYCNFPSVDG